MNPAENISGALDAVQRVKTGAAAFCTNFFPTQRKLQEWVEHGELLVETRPGAAFFLRRDRDFWRFYFCAADAASLRREIATLPELKGRALVTDLVGAEDALRDTADALYDAGFRPYAQLQRMARAGGPPAIGAAMGEAQAVWAGKADALAVLKLLESTFDHFGDQLPFAREIEAAIDARQILVVKLDGILAALLYFETQGLTSTVRYWAVDGRFRGQRLGSALMRQYLELHGSVRRFTLWVMSKNQSAIEKYRHYGYQPDGLVDQVLANELTSA